MPFAVNKDLNIGWILASNEILFFDCSDVENNVQLLY